MSFFDTNIFIYLVLPLMIFVARIFDVSIGTLRIIFVSKGLKTVAPILGFFEVLIWIIAIGKIMQNLDNLACYIGYAAGFATGNWVGMWLEEKLAMGQVVIRIITARNASNLINALKDAGYGTTSVDAQGSIEKVSLIFTTIQRNDLKDVVTIIKLHNPKAFYTVEDVKFVSEGIFPEKKSIHTNPFKELAMFKYWRKDK